MVWSRQPVLVTNYAGEVIKAVDKTTSDLVQASWQMAPDGLFKVYEPQMSRLIEKNHASDAQKATEKLLIVCVCHWMLTTDLTFTKTHEACSVEQSRW